MKKKLRVFYLVLAFVFLAVVAVVTGFGLAVWDTGSSMEEVSAMVFPKTNTVEAKEKKTVEIEDVNISDMVTGKLVPYANVDHPINDDISDGIAPMDKEAGKGSLDDLSSDGGVKASANGTKNKTEADTSEVLNDTKEQVNKEPEKVREPLKITSEISGISTIVRAGDEGDMLDNTLPAPAQITETAQDIDPLSEYPRPLEEVDLSYFDDALFIGDSRVAGLAMNSGTKATFYAVTSFQLYRYKTFKVVQTPNGKVPIFDAMPYDKFTKIYIKVGLNELGTITDEPFINDYTNLINDLRVMQPRAIIYIQGILPVTQVKSETDKVHCNENIRRRNENLKSFAELMKCYYIDVGPYFADETGALRADTTADGIHMYGKYMPEWIDVLRRNAVVWPPKE